jgi:hypothetical protein
MYVLVVDVKGGRPVFSCLFFSIFFLPGLQGERYTHIIKNGISTNLSLLSSFYSHPWWVFGYVFLVGPIELLDPLASLFFFPFFHQGPAAEGR